MAAADIGAAAAAAAGEAKMTSLSYRQ